jgi:hypothetical protein
MKQAITFLLLFLVSCGSLEYTPADPSDLGSFNPNEGNHGRLR